MGSLGSIPGQGSTLLWSESKDPQKHKGWPKKKKTQETKTQAKKKKKMYFLYFYLQNLTILIEE